MRAAESKFLAGTDDGSAAELGAARWARALAGRFAGDGGVKSRCMLELAPCRGPALQSVPIRSGFWGR